MGCCNNKNSNQNLPKPMFSEEQTAGRKVEPVTRQSVAKRMYEAAKQQPNLIGWFKDGVTGLIKCALGKQDYTDVEIQQNRDVCRGCEHSTKNEKGDLTNKSQCMAPDPEKGGAPCGCIIMCKTQVGKCPLNKWTHLTINRDKPENNEVEI